MMLRADRGSPGKEDGVKRILAAMVGAGLVFVLVAPAGAQEAPRDRVKWTERTRDPVIREMVERNKKLEAEARKKTEEIVARLKKERKEEREKRPRMRFGLEGVVRPAGPEAFTTAWHTPPVAQYLTGTCWSFSTTSFMESEIKRLTGREIKLSEMWTVYWEYVEKARGYIDSRGSTYFAEGSESNALLRVYATHGAVPLEAYPGVLAPDGRHDHAAMVKACREFLEWCKEHNYWDPGLIIPTIRRILDLTMGPPPETVEWKGSTMTPQEFLATVCGLDPSDYVSVMSTLSVPFWTHGEYRVPDNWWHDASYVNVPLDVWYGLILDAVRAGSTLVIGGDVSEPGYWGEEDVAVVPTFDIPGEYIDQDSREFRFYNRTSTDDHGIHLVGWTRAGDHDWFLIKDSARSARRGSFDGYLMYRDDYVRLKMLTFTVHRQFLGEILDRVAETEARLAREKAEDGAAERTEPGVPR